MIGLLAYSGSHWDIGRAHGELLSRQIQSNLFSFWAKAKLLGYNKEEMLKEAKAQEPFFPSQLLEEMEGIAQGARLPFPEVLTYNRYQGLLFPEECTVLMAVGGTSTSGETVFMKNSDKIGSDLLVGPHYYKFKEINVVLALAPKRGNKMMGVAAAGSTGLKMGLNDKGVATGSNISRTEELARRKVDVTQLRALDRGQLMREGLAKDNALEAGMLIAAKVLQNPMDTPGNVEFADAHEAVIIEGSYDRVAMEKVRDEVAARANAFVLLKDLNDRQDVSSHCRYLRALQLLSKHRGQVTPDRMIEFSMDHANGPGPNSICRHGTHHSEEVSLAAAVMQINARQPERSRIRIALGKPCHAWRDAEGHIELEMTFDPASLPEPFLSGEIWKKLYLEEARHN